MSGDGRYASIAEQTPQIETLLYLARAYPHLPPAYLTAHAFEGLGVSLLVDSGWEAERWREALEVPAADVTLHRYSDYTTLDIKTVVHGVPLHLFGSTPLLPNRAELTPAEDADRHQTEYPAGSDPAARIGPAAAVRLLHTLTEGAR
jgi:hypothetical protein